MKQQFFAPGRTELAGNHTDHQLGRVLAASVDAGITAAVTPRDDRMVVVHSVGFAAFRVDLDSLAPRAEEIGTSQALVRGVASAMAERGGELCGFEAELSTTIPPGGGLSSSAAFEILFGRIWNELCNDGRFDPPTLARVAQKAENLHFGKPSGLMDQLACATDGAVYVDFLTDEVRAVPACFEALGYTLSLTNTGGSHAGLTDAYAEIPADMRAVAGRFGADVLAHVDESAFRAAYTPTRENDRALHFFDENARVPLMAAALEQRDIETYLRLMNASGRSSEKLLRNIRAASGGDDLLERGLALAAKLLEGKGAWRVHGGGFAGCVQALCPTAEFDAYRAAMEAQFGPGSCMPLHMDHE